MLCEAFDLFLVSWGSQFQYRQHRSLLSTERLKLTDGVLALNSDNKLLFMNGVGVHK